ncbi:hypothetical protein JXJ21_06465 [candidate division KSB1 bacterium]|nr:hypothetical protein [candidate division KSB1 bacterium]
MSFLRKKNLLPAAMALLFPFSIFGASNALINGQQLCTSVVGDTLIFTFDFAPNDTIANVQVWIDLNENLNLDEDLDYQFYNSAVQREPLIDGGYDDVDGMRNGSFTTPIDDFYPLAPAQFIFRISDSGGFTEAYLIQLPLPSPFIIEGMVAEPPNVAHLLVGAFEMGDDSSGSPQAKFKFPRLKILTAMKNQTDEWREILTLTDSTGAFTLFLPAEFPETWMVYSYDMFERLKGYAPPKPQPVFVDGHITGIGLWYIAANAYIGGTVRDEFGAPLEDDFGNPLEVLIGLSASYTGMEMVTETENGAYAFDVVPGEYEISVRSGLPKYMLPMPRHEWISEGDSLKDIDFQMYHTDAEISGHVLLTDQPLGDVRVFAFSQVAGISMGNSRADGSFTLPVASIAGEYFLELNSENVPPGFEVEGGNHQMAHSGDTDVVFRLVEMQTAPSILDVVDIPMDQGRQVRVIWNRSSFDRKEGWMGPVITQYSVWRGVAVNSPVSTDENKIELIESLNLLGNRLTEAKAGAQFLQADGRPMLWDFVATIPATQRERYAYVAPTLGDSTLHGIWWSYFQIVAHTDWTLENYASRIDSGYSVDNLRPPSPIVLLNVAQDGIELSWDANTHDDVVRYQIYRSESPGFDPDVTANLIAITGDMHFKDMKVRDGITYYYRVEAIDDAWNATFSDEVNILFTEVTLAPVDALPTVYELCQNFPNPFNPVTEISYQVPCDGQVILEVYNVKGEKVATLVNGFSKAGKFRILWNGRDDYGQIIASGIYLYRLRAQSYTELKRMLLLR